MEIVERIMKIAKYLITPFCFFIVLILSFNLYGDTESSLVDIIYEDDSTFISLVKQLFENTSMTGNLLHEENMNDFPLLLYKVKKGDNIWNIAKKSNTSISTIYSINNINQEGNLIKQGQKFIILKNKKGILHKVKKGETLEKIAQKYSKNGVTLSLLKSVNDIRESDSIRPGENIFIPGATLSNREIKERSNPKWILPLKKSGSKITSEFSKWRVIWINGKKYSGPHKGIDIANKLKTNIYASRKGIVKFVGYKTGYGRVVYINHGDGYESRYAHLLSYKVKKGQWVEQGQIIGKLGNTGRSTGPHVHFEIRYKKTAKNPRNYVKELSTLPKKK